MKIAKPEYLMAAKLSALAVGATGREAESELNLVKDVFDFNCMADEFPGLNNEIHGAIVEITRQQNKLHKTSHSVADVYGAVRKTLRGMAHIKGESSLITQGALKSFSQYLVGVPGSRWGHMKWGEFVWGEGGKAGELTRTALAVLAMRALYYSIEIEKKKKLGDVEKIIMEKVADRVFVSECERKLAEGGEDQLWLHELKILAPAALIYLYYSRFPES